MTATVPSSPAARVPRGPGGASAPRRGGRRGGPEARPRRQLVGASSMVLVGSFLPWVMTGVGTFPGVLGAGLWTFYAAMLGLAGGIVPVRRLAIAQGALLAAAALGLAGWQVVHLLTLVGFAGWLPGPGLVMVLGGGVLAAAAVRGLLRSPAVTSPGAVR